MVEVVVAAMTWKQKQKTRDVMLKTSAMRTDATITKGTKMTKQRFIHHHKVDPDTLEWKHVKLSNGLCYEFVEAGPYTIYHDDAWGYYIAGSDNLVVHRTIDLRKYL